MKVVIFIFKLFKKPKQEVAEVTVYSDGYEYKRYFYNVYIDNEIITKKTCYTRRSFEDIIEDSIFRKGFIEYGATIYPINKILKIKKKDTQVFKIKFKLDDFIGCYYITDDVKQDRVERIDNDILYVE